MRQTSLSCLEQGAAEEVLPHFSLHAIAGVRLNDMMQIHITLSTTSLVALLDSGSTHNFISEAVVQWTELSPTTLPAHDGHGHQRRAA
jgi:hypothetical protein